MKHLLRIIAFALCLGGVASAAAAQPPTSYVLKVFNQGAPSPFTTSTLAATGFICGQTPKVIVSGAQLNPTKLVYDDPADVTKDCVFVDPGTGPLLALPFATQVYTATLAIVNTAGTSPDSAASNPFSRPGLPSNAPTGLRVGR